MEESVRILLAGETWTTVTSVINGANLLHGGATRVNSATALIQALRETGMELDHLPGEEVGSGFPSTPAELNRYDAIVIGDVGADSFALTPQLYETGSPQPDRLQAVASYVAEGGGLLMIGGYMSFSGKAALAGYGRTVLAEVLPVMMSDSDDRVETPGGSIPTVNCWHNVLEGLTPPWPPLLGYNRVVSKPDTTAVLHIGSDPLLVLGEHGAGRTAAFTSDCAPHWASTEFLQWAGYSPFFAAVLRFCAGNSAAASKENLHG